MQEQGGTKNSSETMAILPAFTSCCLLGPAASHNVVHRVTISSQVQRDCRKLGGRAALHAQKNNIRWARDLLRSTAATPSHHSYNVACSLALSPA